MDTPLRISAKALGELTLPNFCPKCFWLKLHVDKLPFQIFPGIFSSIDSYTKKIIHYHFDNVRSFPLWLSELGELTGYINPPHYTKFRIVDRNSNVTLWGTPDGIFTKSDGSHLIVDYKTAKYTEGQDRLMPVYQVQLNAYAKIGEQCGLNPVSGLALIYMEPITDSDSALYVGNNREYGFDMGFSATVHWVDLNLDSIPVLLARAKDIYELSTAPEGLQGCRDCVSLDNLITTTRLV
ncbi:PD-(D/E)XK nuclease family protein [Chloroflexota bacterium]